MMSHGYEVQLTPLQILTFYNAVANDGEDDGDLIVCECHSQKRIGDKSYQPEVIIN